MSLHVTYTRKAGQQDSRETGMEGTDRVQLAPNIPRGELEGLIRRERRLLDFEDTGYALGAVLRNGAAEEVCDDRARV